MRKIQLDYQPKLLRWAEDRLHSQGTRAAFRNDSPVLSVWNGELLGVVIFTHYNGPHVEMSIVTDSPKWATKEFIRRAFDFAFNDLEVEHIGTTVREDNQRSIDITSKLGFTVEGIMRKRVTDFDENVYDCISFGMVKDECRWL